MLYAVYVVIVANFRGSFMAKLKCIQNCHHNLFCVRHIVLSCPLKCLRFQYQRRDHLHGMHVEYTILKSLSESYLIIFKKMSACIPSECLTLYYVTNVFICKHLSTTLHNLVLVGGAKCKQRILVVIQLCILERWLMCPDKEVYSLLPHPDFLAYYY